MRRVRGLVGCRCSSSSRGISSNNIITNSSNTISSSSIDSSNINNISNSNSSNNNINNISSSNTSNNTTSNNNNNNNTSNREWEAWASGTKTSRTWDRQHRTSTTGSRRWRLIGYVLFLCPLFPPVWPPSPRRPLHLFQTAAANYKNTGTNGTSGAGIQLQRHGG